MFLSLYFKALHRLHMPFPDFSSDNGCHLSSVEIGDQGGVFFINNLNRPEYVLFSYSFNW